MCFYKGLSFRQIKLRRIEIKSNTNILRNNYLIMVHFILRVVYFISNYIFISTFVDQYSSFRNFHPGWGFINYVLCAVITGLISFFSIRFNLMRLKDKKGDYIVMFFSFFLTLVIQSIPI